MCRSKLILCDYNTSLHLIDCTYNFVQRAALKEIFHGNLTCQAVALKWIRWRCVVYRPHSRAGKYFGFCVQGTSVYESIMVRNITKSIVLIIFKTLVLLFLFLYLYKDLDTVPRLSASHVVIIHSWPFHLLVCVMFLLFFISVVS